MVQGIDYLWQLPVVQMPDKRVIHGIHETCRELDSMVPSPRLVPDNAAARECVQAYELQVNPLYWPVSCRSHAVCHSWSISFS